MYASVLEKILKPVMEHVPDARDGEDLLRLALPITAFLPIVLYGAAVSRRRSCCLASCTSGGLLFVNSCPTMKMRNQLRPGAFPYRSTRVQRNIFLPVIYVASEIAAA